MFRRGCGGHDGRNGQRDGYDHHERGQDADLSFAELNFVPVKASDQKAASENLDFINKKKIDSTIENVLRTSRE